MNIMKSTYWILTLCMCFTFCSCDGKIQSKSEQSSISEMNTPDSINKKVSLKDLNLDSIIIDCDVVMWAHYYQLIINDSNAILQGGRDFGKNNWEQPVELSNKDRNSIINYLDEFYVSKTHNIIAKKYKTGEYVEGDFTQITITIFRRDGSKDKHKIDTHSIQNGYSIEFSKECNDFLDLLHVLAGRYSYPEKRHCSTT